MAKQGFGGQWVEVCRVGKAIDSTGKSRNITKEMLEAAVTNYNAGTHEAPLTIGHPKTDAPAYGWAEEFRMNGEVLEMKAGDTDDQFEQLIKDGRFRTRSVSMWESHPTVPAPNIKHVAFLGAEAPAVKGLRKIQFSETAEGESFVLEETINLQENNSMGLEDKDVEKVTEGVFEKIKNYFKSAEGAAAASPAIADLSEAKVAGMITEALSTAREEVTAEFKEQIETLTAENKDLKEKVDGQISSGKRAEIVSFVESIPAEKGKHFLKNAGVIEFMESLAEADATDEQPAICLSEGEGDDKVEHKLSRVDWFKNYVNAQESFVEFGEKFGGITATAAADTMVRNDVTKSINNTLGKSDEGGEK
jgi:hypothetical protein